MVKNLVYPLDLNKDPKGRPSSYLSTHPRQDLNKVHSAGLRRDPSTDISTKPRTDLSTDLSMDSSKVLWTDLSTYLVIDPQSIPIVQTRVHTYSRTDPSTDSRNHSTKPAANSRADPSTDRITDISKGSTLPNAELLSAEL